MKKHLLFIIVLLMSGLFANSEMGCSISGLLKPTKNILIESLNEDNCSEEREPHGMVDKTAITESLKSVTVLHENEKVVIERERLNEKGTCPPFCIEPMQIKDVVTVAELEVLTFIDKLKEKKARLLIDVRKNSFYREGTIPGAINLPFYMLKDESNYQEKVLKLLGAKLKKKTSKQKWSFKHAQILLVFGDSLTSNEASTVIKKLLDLGYPSSKLLYYRAGIKSWKILGLTIY